MAATARRRITLDKIHKYAGLVAALWMAVLAVTGMMQLNRQGWDWLWASGPALDESHAGHDDKNLWRYHKIDPANPATRVAGGAAGAFLSENGGKGWTRLPFGDAPIRNVQAMEPVAGPDGWTVYVGTSDGVWRLDRATKRFVPRGLQGKMVNSLSVEGDRIIAAVRMSQMFQRALDPNKMAWEPVKLAPLPADAGASSIDLGRMLQDIHVGRGLFGGMIDMILWNLIALGLFLMAATGLAYWGFMRWCNRARKRPKEARPSSDAMKRAQKGIQWSFRVHAMIIGIVLAPFLLLVFITGIYQDHRGDVQMMFRKMTVPSAILPPAYRAGAGWQGQVMNVALAKDGGGELLAIGNRRGMFVSRDMGQSWSHEAGFKGPAMRMRKIGGTLYVPGRMMRRVQVRRDDGWQTLDVPKMVVMINEMSAGPDGSIWWTRDRNVFKTTLAGQMRGKMLHNPPKLGYLPWASFAAELHEGSLISKQWKWINDLFALLGITLVVTGFLRWRKRKW